MITDRNTSSKLTIPDAEKASTSYLISLLAIFVGPPFPIVNLIACIIFYFGNQKSSYYVRFHCTQALLNQLLIFCINAILLFWSLKIIFSNLYFNDYYITYLVTAILINFIEFIVTIILAINVRKGKHVKLFIFGYITEMLLGPETKGVYKENGIF